MIYQFSFLLQKKEDSDSKVTPANGMIKCHDVESSLVKHLLM